MHFTRRHIVTMGASSLAFFGLGSSSALAGLFDQAVKEFTGGNTLTDGDISIVAPEIAENGGSVLVSVDAPGAETIGIFAPENPEPIIARLSFGSLSASQSASTRVRLATTQDVIAIAKMPDGSVHMAKTNVKVTIGGCGG